MSRFRSADPGRFAGSRLESGTANIVTMRCDDSCVNRFAFCNAVDHERPLVLAKTVSSACGRVKNLLNNVSPYQPYCLRAVHLPVTFLDDATLEGYIVGIH